LPTFVHRIGDDLADGGIAIGGNRTDLGDLLRGRDVAREFLQVFDDRADGFVDARLQIHRVHPRGHVLHAFLHDRLCQHGCGGGAAPGDIRSLGGDLLHHLRAHVFELVLQVDFLGHGYAVLGDRGRAERAFQHDVASLRTQGYFDRIGQNICAVHDARKGGIMESDFFGCHS
jgi:hypothetical protein